jgi:hypothetical protein
MALAPLAQTPARAGEMVLHQVDGPPPAALMCVLLLGALCYVWALADFILVAGHPWITTHRRPSLPRRRWLLYCIHLVLLPYLGLEVYGILEFVRAEAVHVLLGR